MNQRHVYIGQKHGHQQRQQAPAGRQSARAASQQPHLPNSSAAPLTYTSASGAGSKGGHNGQVSGRVYEMPEAGQHEQQGQRSMQLRLLSVSDPTDRATPGMVSWRYEAIFV